MYISNVSNSITKNPVNIDLFANAIAKLRDNSELFQKLYTSAQPYPHIVIDDLFEPEILDRVLDEFPNSKRNWVNWDTEHEVKSTSGGITGLSMFTQILCLWLSSGEFIEEIKKIVGIKDLVGDPLFFGAGLHEMRRDGWLEMHADYTKHPVLPMTRRINLLTYLNKDWNPAWGGDLELWDQPNPTQKVSCPPFFNKTVIFLTTPHTYHGVPHRLLCPPERSRKLLSIYYWSPVDEGSTIQWASEHGHDFISKTKQKLKTFITGRNVSRHISPP